MTERDVGIPVTKEIRMKIKALKGMQTYSQFLNILLEKDWRELGDLQND